jgi:hypothetical protein
MTKCRSPRCKKPSVSASELAQMGVCERMVVMEHRYGKCATEGQQRAMRRGRLAHRRFYLEPHTTLSGLWLCILAWLFPEQGLVRRILKWFGG